MSSATGTFSEPTFTAHAGKNLGACQVRIIREQQDDPTSSTRFFATSRLKDTLEQVADTAAKCWTVETLFADFKERMGSDQYQLEGEFVPLDFCFINVDAHKNSFNKVSPIHIKISQSANQGKREKPSKEIGANATFL